MRDARFALVPVAVLALAAALSLPDAHAVLRAAPIAGGAEAPAAARPPATTAGGAGASGAAGAGAAAPAGGSAGTAAAADLDPDLVALYIDLHRNPELSLHEQKTAAKLAERLRRLGFEVTVGVGGTGVVGVLRNGAGPTVMLRTELDALPVEEKTGLPYASTVKARNDAGLEVPVMHACGHDVHMTVWAGTAARMAQARTSWHGTLVLIAQPAEEVVKGAKAMLADGLFTRFPKPDYVVALHDSPKVPAGKIGYTPGFILASSDSVDVTIYGKGGHGAAPQTTVDPVVIAARTIVAWQTIVSREKDPQEPAVVTVGSIHGGTKHNIIPDEVKLQLTVRTYSREVRRHVLDAIARIARGEAAAAGAAREPTVGVVESTPATYNDPKLTARVAAALGRQLGADNVVEVPREMASEDFSEYGLAGVPAVMVRLGAAEPAALAKAQAAGQELPSLHSSLFAPDRDPTLRTGVAAEMAMLLDLLGKPAG
ncbi:MAG TPA: amidohydrolase [Thermoanaerobaculia bacterium]|nr:amidohydrolase [Thermoanaerobaculia bacterium]